MTKLPQPSRSGNPDSPTRPASPWVDLIAFLAILALGGVLIAFGRVTAGSLATICAALGGLYGVWKRLRPSDPVPRADTSRRKPRKRHR